VYDRVLGDQRAIVAFNVSDAPQEVSVEVEGSFRAAYPVGDRSTVADGKVGAGLPAKAARIWIRE
jgi:hypothetical protein